MKPKASSIARNLTLPPFFSASIGVRVMPGLAS